ncbi:MAG: response regulator [Nitrospinaceae bacterium]|nr:MAG: response regulator [Nitrospinaceae bacterium]
MNQGKIIIIEDEPDIFKILMMSEGYEFLDAPDGETAKEILTTANNLWEVGLIILDIRMSSVKGMQSLDLLTRQVPWIPLLAITGFPDKNLESLILDKGAKGVLVKPLEKETLLEMVGKLFFVKETSEDDVLSVVKFINK